MTAGPIIIICTDGLLTIALSHGESYSELPLITGFFGLIIRRSLQKSLGTKGDARYLGNRR